MEMELWTPNVHPLRNFFDFQPHALMSPLEEMTRDMDRDFNREFHRLERRLRSALPHDLAPLTHALDTTTSVGLQPAIVKEGDARKYQLSINMGANFNPEDVKVSMKDGVVSVHAKREKVSEDGNSRFYKEVTRRFTLPTTVDAKQLKSALTPDGVLKIEAPLPAEALPEPPKHKEIPVKIE